MSSELTGLTFKIRKPSAPASSSSLSTPESVAPLNPKEAPAPFRAAASSSSNNRRIRRSRILSSDDDSDADAPRSSSAPQRTPAVDDSESEYEDDVDVDSVDRTPAVLTRASSSSRKPAVARRAIIKSAKASDKTTASEKPIATKDERTNKSATGTSALKRSRVEADDGAGTPGAASTSKGTNEPDATEPVAKKPKLPSMRKKSRPGNASLPIPKAPTAAPVLPPRPPAPKPKSTEVDLNNQDEYNKLFGISGSSTPNAAKKSTPVTTSSTNYKTAEQKAREIAAARERAIIERDQEWLPNNTFDLQASGDRIRAYEAKLWEERRYMYMSQIASAWIVLPPAPVDIVPPQPPALAQSSPPKKSQSNGHDMKT